MAADDLAGFSSPNAISDNTQPVSVPTTAAVPAKLMQDSPIAMPVSTRADGRLLAVNDRFVRLGGYPRNELIGQTLDGLGLWRDPAQRAERVAALASGGPLGDGEATICTQSGAEHPVLAAESEVAIHGRACLLIQLADVTAHRQAEQFKDDVLALLSREVRPR